MRAAMHHRLPLRVIPFFLLVAVCEFGPGCSSSPASHETPTFNFAWDWTGIVGTGQSLSVGDHGTPVIATQQPYDNLKLALGGATVVPPFDPDDRVADARTADRADPPVATSYPSAYPANIYGETPHTAMANQLTAMAMAMARTTTSGPHRRRRVGPADDRHQEEPHRLPDRGTRAARTTRRCSRRRRSRGSPAAGKTYGIGAIVLTHGESDAGNTTYANDIYQLLTDYNADLAAITGQTAKIPMLVSQQNSVPADAGTVSMSALQVLKASVDHPGESSARARSISTRTRPTAHVHLTAPEYERLGEKTAQVYFERVVLGHDWQPLQPTSAERERQRHHRALSRAGAAAGLGRHPPPPHGR